MKKVFILPLILSIFFTAQAGYVIRGIDTNLPPYYDDLKNYTLTFGPDGMAISAASMHTMSTPGTGKNTIVIIRADDPWARLFPITNLAVPGLPNDVEVRDFHYDKNNDVYVLCGFRRSSLGTNAFVAVINGGTMQFMEYPVVDMFYSLCDPNNPVLGDYHLCGKRGDRGIIASVDRGTLHITDFYVTNEEWEYHKIIAKSSGLIAPDMFFFAASGRNPKCTHIGFTTLNLSFAPVNSYMWAQPTDPRSLCVIIDDPMENNSVILASSEENTAILNPVTFPLSLPQRVRAIRFRLQLDDIYYVQDIGTILNHNVLRISVAGFRRYFSQNIAWHGYMIGSPNSVMMNNDYDGLGDYEHYKIRYQAGDEYTGGYFQNVDEMGALFGAPPLTVFNECGPNYYSDPNLGYIDWSSFTLQHENRSFLYDIGYDATTEYMDFEDECFPPFKGGDPVPKSIPAENESEITAFPDRITIKDAPANTRYQIYNTIGQLIQTGTTNPDISTANLNKGVYILRLENGKTVKFVR